MQINLTQDERKESQTPHTTLTTGGLIDGTGTSGESISSEENKHNIPLKAL